MTGFRLDISRLGGPEVLSGPVGAENRVASGPWSTGFSSGFGLPTLASNKNRELMALLGSNTTMSLYYDFSETECFYLFILPSDFGLDFNSDFGPLSPGALYKITPRMAQQWFGTAGRVIYNPFTSIPASAVL